MNTHWISLWHKQWPTRDPYGILVVSSYVDASSVEVALRCSASGNNLLLPFLGKKLKKQFLDHRFFEGIHDPMYSNRRWKAKIGQHMLLIYKLKKNRE